MVVLGIVAMWAYAFSPLAQGPAPDALNDTTLGLRAEVVSSEAAA